MNNENITELFRPKESTATSTQITMECEYEFDAESTIPYAYIHRFRDGYLYMGEELAEQVLIGMVSQWQEGWFWSALKTLLPSTYEYFAKQLGDGLTLEEKLQHSEWRYVFLAADESTFLSKLEVAVRYSKLNFRNFLWSYGTEYMSVWIDPEEPPHKLQINLSLRNQIHEHSRLKRDEERKAALAANGGKLPAPDISVYDQLQADPSTSFKHWHGVLHTYSSYYHSDTIVDDCILWAGRKCIEFSFLAESESESELLKRIKLDKELGYPAKYENQRKMEFARIDNNKFLPKFISTLVKRGLVQEAIESCANFEKYKFHDGSKAGFVGRRKKLEANLSKMT